MYESWTDLDRAVNGLTPKQATTRHDGGSAIAWTLCHVTNMVDSWINMRFQRLPPHPAISQPMVRTGGSGDAKDWPIILTAVKKVREAARRFLDSAQEPDLDRVIPYDGSINFLRTTGLPPRYALMRIAAHHYIHIGEIVTIRSRLGHEIEDFPEWGMALIRQSSPPI
jgi:hypothetical protein